MKIFLNGKIVPERKAKISVFDRGFLYGDGIFETMLARSGRVFRLQEHISRLLDSAKLISLSLPWATKYLASAINSTLKANKLSSARIRISISRGEGPSGYMSKITAKPTIVIAASEFNGWPEECYKKGVKVIISKVRRNHPLTLNPKIKSANCLNQILAAQEAIKQNAFEAIMLNLDGYIAEGTISNIFIIKSGVLYTPSLSTGILDGVTRGTVMDVARAEHIKVTEIALKPDDLYRADECFITSTTMGVMPVTRIGSKKISEGLPGASTTLLKEKLWALVESLTKKR